MEFWKKFDGIITKISDESFNFGEFFLNKTQILRYLVTQEIVFLECGCIAVGYRRRPGRSVEECCIFSAVCTGILVLCMYVCVHRQQECMYAYMHRVQ